MHMLRILSRAAVIAASTGWMLAPSAASAATNSYTCTAAGFTASGDGQGNLTISCTDPATTPPPTSCTVTASRTLVPSTGGTVTITATNCGTISGWTGAVAVTPGTAASFTDTLPANAGASTASYTYQVTGNGTPATASVTVNVSAPSTSPPPTGTISCSGYSTQVVDIPWGAIASGNVRVTTKGFTNGMIAVARFTTPNVTIPAGSIVRAKVASAESNSSTGPILRTAAFSDTPCVFPSPNPMGSFATVVGSTSPSVTYQVNGTSLYYPLLKPNTTYYFNIKNEYKGAPTCPSKFSSCDMYVELSKPTGW